MTNSLPAEPPRWVRVWFGSHIVKEHIATRDEAEKYAAAMEQRFAGLRVTNDPEPPERPSRAVPLPPALLWDLTP